MIIAGTIVAFAFAAAAADPELGVSPNQAAGGSGLTPTETLIRAEIIKRGGDWEGQEHAVFAALIGGRFSERDLELLAHLPTLKNIVLSEIDFGPAGSANLAAVACLERIDVHHGTIAGGGLAPLGSCRLLRKITLEEVEVASTSNLGLASLRTVQHIEATNCSLSAKDFEDMKEMPNLSSLHIDGRRGNTKAEVQEVLTSILASKKAAGRRATGATSGGAGFPPVRATRNPLAPGD